MANVLRIRILLVSFRAFHFLTNGPTDPIKSQNQQTRTMARGWSGAWVGVGMWMGYGLFWFLCFLVSWFLGFLVSWFLGILVYRFLVSWLLSFEGSWFLSFLVSTFLRFKVFVSWFRSSRVSKIQKYVLYFGKISIPYYQMSISCCLEDTDPIFKISKNFLDDSLGMGRWEGASIIDCIPLID